MTWTLVGWVAIGLSALLLGLFWVLSKQSGFYPGRKIPSTESLLRAQINSIERGQHRQIILGDQFWSFTYPGLGLHALNNLSSFLDSETAVEGGLTISAGNPELVVFARQIVHQSYRDGFSSNLPPARIQTVLPGPTPLSLTAGLLPVLNTSRHGSLALFGHYGPEAILWTEAARSRGSAIFAAAGTLSSQAALFLSVHDLVLGENVFMLPGLLKMRQEDQASWLAEDILRILLMLGLIIGAALKLAGVL